jgi:predicted nucleic acid-binding protein
VILIDTSAWIEFLRDTGSAVCTKVDELLAGARSHRHLRELGGLLARAVTLGTAPAHYDEAAALYRACRSEGETVRKLIDCLIAAHAITSEAELLHADGDFEVLARHTPLRLASVDLQG